MKLALIGYGKMGKEVEALALSQGHEVPLIFDANNIASLNADCLRKVDAIIEFTSPQSAPANIALCFETGVPVICGSTGWHDKLPEISELCRAKNACLFYASNFSIGMNIFMEINRQLATIISDFPAYSAHIDETHHIHKLDKPSGTAISIANDIIARHNRYVKWKLNSGDDISDLPVFSFREGEITGDHHVIWQSDIDDISIRHSAKNRKGFALGAIMAAQYCIGKKGIFGMHDLLTKR